jgi:hypothetical protein
LKGVIFTEFLAHVEKQHSIEMADRIIEACDLASRGAYTSVGTYDPGEMVALVQALGAETGTPIPQLLRGLGHHLFGRLARAHPHLLDETPTAFDMLEGIEDSIHAEVRKLYDGAELPSIRATRLDDDTLEIIYSSPRNLPDLAEGLIRGGLEHFGEVAQLTRETLEDTGQTATRFLITREG